MKTLSPLYHFLFLLYVHLIRVKCFKNGIIIADLLIYTVCAIKCFFCNSSAASENN